MTVTLRQMRPADVEGVRACAVVAVTSTSVETPDGVAWRSRRGGG
jgi:hypothetical protein